MSTENPTHKQNPISNYHPKDVSRFTRWVHQMDEKDRLMASPRRKQKWLILMGALFLFFILSFFWVPSVQLSHGDLDVLPTTDSMQVTGSVPIPFEIPADSFEQQLKLRLHENFSERK
jgi:hypothetical protein